MMRTGSGAAGQPARCSNAAPRRKTAASAPGGPAIWSPIGSPLAVVPHGTDSAGVPRMSNVRVPT